MSISTRTDVLVFYFGENMFSYFIAEKKRELLEGKIDTGSLRFQYGESRKTQELLNYYKKEKGVDSKAITEILSDNCIIFEDLHYGSDNESNHEDLIDAGYVLGFIHAKNPGRIVALDHDKFRYYFIGDESDIYTNIKVEMNKLANK